MDLHKNVARHIYEGGHMMYHVRESLEKLPATKGMMPPGFMRRLFNWYFTRIYVYVRPERVFVWPGGV